MKRHKTRLASQHGAINGHAVNRVDPIQYHHRDARAGGCFHRQPQGRGISIESAADVLNVEHQHIDLLELFLRGRLLFSVETDHGQPGPFIDRVANLLVHVPVKAMLGTE